MATPSPRSSFNPFPKIDSVPNLRLLCKRAANAPTSLDRSAAIYRSANPDRLTVADLDEFRKLGIKCIVDFRSHKEYIATDHGPRLLDKEYVLYEVIVPKNNYMPGQSVKYEHVSLKNGESLSSRHSDNGKKNDLGDTSSVDNQSLLGKRHLLINFFSFKYIKTVFSRLPWHLWCLGILHLVWDIMTWNNLKTFKKFIATKAISTWGIFGQYVDILEVGQPAICSALKLISDPENSPVLINCAFGKDRTGIMSALILTCLGMSKEYVVEDYTLSTKGLDPVRQQVYDVIVGKHCLAEEFCRSEAKTMRDLLTYIEDRYQSVEKYMTIIGFTEQEQCQLRSNFEASPRVPSDNYL